MATKLQTIPCKSNLRNAKVKRLNLVNLLPSKVPQNSDASQLSTTARTKFTEKLAKDKVLSSARPTAARYTSKAHERERGKNFSPSLLSPKTATRRPMMAKRKSEEYGSGSKFGQAKKSLREPIAALLAVAISQKRKTSLMSSQRLSLKEKLSPKPGPDQPNLNPGKIPSEKARKAISPGNERQFVKAVSPLPSELPSQAYPLPESPKDKDICSKVLIVGDEIGKGAYAVVKTAYHKQLGKIVALKVYSKFDCKVIQRRTAIQREVEVMKLMHSPHIVKLYEVLETKTQVILIMEYIKGKSLYEYVKESNGKRLNEEEAKRVFKQVLEGVVYCQKKGIAHRDIKLENVLLDESNNAKIIDFGFSTFVTSKGVVKMYCGTPSYMAPEIITRIEYVSLHADIWALGILLFAMLCGKFPFKRTNDKDLPQSACIEKVNFPLHVSAQAKSLIIRMLQVEPNKRPSVEELLLDGWLNALSPAVELIENREPTSQPKSDCTNSLLRQSKETGKRYLACKVTIPSRRNSSSNGHRNPACCLINKKRFKDHKIFHGATALANVTTNQVKERASNNFSLHKYMKEQRASNTVLEGKKAKNSRTKTRFDSMVGSRKSLVKEELFNSTCPFVAPSY